MSIVAEQASTVFESESLEDRNAERYNGMLVAIAASIGLWGGIAAGIWGIISLFD